MPAEPVNEHAAPSQTLIANWQIQAAEDPNIIECDTPNIMAFVSRFLIQPSYFLITNYIPLFWSFVVTTGCMLTFSVKNLS